MKKAIIYCRVSTTSEDDKSSLQAQEAACRQYLEELSDYEVIEVISDVEELENPDRAGISKLLTMSSERQLNAICIDRRERLGSDSDVTTILVGDLDDLGAEVLFVTSEDDAGDAADDSGTDTNGPTT